MTNIYKRKPKTSRVCTKPRSDLQRLSAAVNFAINFRIQKCHLPRELEASSTTYYLLRTIAEKQAELAISIRADYERQRADILDKREKIKP